jgi:ribosome-binding protein aMBF1 (putative translation factor)
MGDNAGPAGRPVSEHIKKSMTDPAFRAEYERLEPYEALAHIVITRRASLGLTQAQLASRMGTTASAVSRIESGQHATSARTLKRLGEALEARAVLGFQFGPSDHPEQELVVL